MSENEQDTNVDHFRYTPGAQTSSYSMSDGKMMDVYLPKGEMQPVEQPIYEETF